MSLSIRCFDCDIARRQALQFSIDAGHLRRVIPRLRDENEALRYALQDCSGMSFDEIDESHLSHLRRALGDDDS